jgi:hypothetical protein
MYRRFFCVPEWVLLMTASHACPAFLIALVLIAGPRPATAQPHRLAAPQAESEAPVVVKATPSPRERLSVGDVGQALVPREPRRRPLAERSAAAFQQRQDEVTTDEFTRGALIGGAAGAAAGAVVGAVLGGDANPRWETALPVAAAGLAVGAPTGAYVYTGRPSRYRWGTAGVVAAAALGTVLYFAEVR